jgi:hypothetical protein
VAPPLSTNVGTRKKKEVCIVSNTDMQEEVQAVPLACLLTGEDLKARGEVVQPLMASHQKLQELEDGYAFQFPGEPEWIQRVVSFVTEERQCCPFFTFELQYEPNLGPIWLRLRGSVEIKALLRDQWLSQL